ncbi:MAG: replication-associated recombination protein A [Deltaproteobacteria bacterium]|nr:MAG: replication-associated recombination protein A [Deltaproteobacteria bacterium]
MEDLFTAAARRDPAHRPLPDRLRPSRLDEIVGQAHLVGPGALLRRAIEADRIPSMILWGPPGTGKTTLAQVIAATTRSEFVPFSAVLGGVKEIREIVAAARRRLAERRVRTLLFIDEIHRFNKSQQDALLPHVENGTVVLIGATTENPSFEVNAALLSRARVFRLHPLEPREIRTVVERGLGALEVEADEAAIEFLARAAGGDARIALSALELAAAPGGPVTLARMEEALQATALRHDKSGDQHYDVVSAFIKSMRGSDPDAALYWMCRMLEAGESPRFILRRMLIFAAEDVGNADPRALEVAAAAAQAFEWVGLPEGAIPMAQACTYLATAPKSNASYLALREAQAAVRAHGPLEVPLHLRNAPTGLMKAMGHGQGYRYAHDYEGGHVAQQHLPDALAEARFYRPKDLGYESKIAARMKRWKEET